MTTGSVWKRIFLVLGSIVLVLAGIVAVFAVLWEDRWYAAFGSDEYYVGVDGSSILADRTVWIEIDTPDDEARVMIDSAKTDQALKLFEAAKTGQSSSWHEVGSMNDTDDPHDWFISRMTISAGPGVRLTIRDGGSCLSYDLRPQDLAAFERAMRSARLHFDSGDIDKGLTPHWNPPDDAFQRGGKSSDPIPQKFPGCG
jgi:hypothetical protein